MKKNETAAEDRVLRESEPESPETADTAVTPVPPERAETAESPAVPERAEEPKEKKKKSGWRIFLLVLAILLLAILLAAIGLTTALIVKYRRTSYEYQKPVERKEEYVMPEYPEVILIPDGVDPDTFVPETEMLIPAEETVPESPEKPEQPEQPESAQHAQDQQTETAKPAETQQTEAKPAQPSASKTEQPAKPAQDQQSGSKKTGSTSSDSIEENVQTNRPGQTDQTSQSGQTQTTQWTGETLPNSVNTPAPKPQIVYDTNASFGNSPNAVSVYAGVPIYKVKQKNADVQNILVMGTDTRDVTMDRGRSDVMVIVSYNRKTGSVKLTSLLRDSFVPIEEHGWERLNTAYFYGGVGLTINTVNQLYGLDIQDFVVIDFNGVKDFIDYIGGVDVYLTQAEVDYYGWPGTAEGVNHLDRNQVLAHIRNRGLDSDFGRTRRQRDVITAVLKDVTRKSLTEIYDITGYAFSLIRTNISATSMASLAASVLSNASKLSVETQNVPYSDAYQNAFYGSLGAVLSYDIGEAAVRINDFIYK